MNHTLSLRIELGCCLLLAAAICAAAEARAQDMRLPLTPAPPPMKFVPRSDQAQLGVARDPKSRTRATIDLAEARLVRAEQFTTSQQFEAASDELGIYQGLIEDALRFLSNARKPNNKMRDVYKRLELALRLHGARIESIRRATPSEYKVNLNNIADFTCTARTEALNGFFGDEVMREAGCDKVGSAPTATAATVAAPAKESAPQSAEAVTKKSNDQ